MMLVTLVIAAFLGWWLDRSHQASEAGRYKEALMKLRRIGMAVGSLVGQDLQEELNATWEAESAYHASHPSKPVAKKR